ncbi:MAG: hypothetical protein KZQ64_02610 [gamma proteobacterium symbiont of Bathyaustriella thionipta]|nr:hypothetical protein [gamma proteobacterium symbiont of Bathyaustriella thionipta]MCU7951575.1 hypothetical protein [gamma proteobacterium symbiont of Bathyaustriella thionipta]MCU7952281.1 hypothetical protein [gamma proteobacterium symbiont of Bathyaustriella thionipta]MCU7958181.1 hypothetical protein [gamma proteobacterium symbiont of Bathyaustriella thionipta]MCU7968784.1 hypothetical protein [gamma proteobacterium symbiont of Bathyaustriella thionipta]
MNRLFPTFLILIISYALLAGWLSATQKTILYSEKKLALIKEQYGETVSNRLVNWKKFVTTNLDKSETERLQLTNDFFNTQLLWITDSKLWKQKGNYSA